MIFYAPPVGLKGRQGESVVKKLISVRMSTSALQVLEGLQEIWGTNQAETISQALERAWWDEQTKKLMRMKATDGEAERARVETPAVPVVVDDELHRLQRCVGDIGALSEDALFGGVSKDFALSRIRYLADAMLPPDAPDVRDGEARR